MGRSRQGRGELHLIQLALHTRHVSKGCRAKDAMSSSPSSKILVAGALLWCARRSASIERSIVSLTRLASCSRTSRASLWRQMPMLSRQADAADRSLTSSAVSFSGGQSKGHPLAFPTLAVRRRGDIGEARAANKRERDVGGIRRCYHASGHGTLSMGLTRFHLGRPA